MDSDGTIDISHLTLDEYKLEMRRLQYRYTCPCYFCDAICTDWVFCKKYQSWYKSCILRDIKR